MEKKLRLYPDRSMEGVLIKNKLDAIKTGLFDLSDPKVHIWQAWRIEFSYKDIREYKARSV